MWGFRKNEHQRIREMLSAYLDGELTPRDKARVERHLQECPACAEDLRTLRWTVGLVREVPSVPVPLPFTVPAPIPQRRAERPRLGWTYGFLRGATALAAVLLVLVLSGDLLSQRFFKAPTPAPAPSVVEEKAAPVRTFEVQEERAEDLAPVEAEKEVEKAVAPAAKVLPTPSEAGSAERSAIPTPSATAEQPREIPPTPPVEEIVPPQRPMIGRLRQIELALLAATIILAMTTAVVSRRRRG
jgi:hypothetical protein